MSVLCRSSTLVVIAAALAGCGSVPALPETFDAATSATEKSEAPRDSGPPRFGDNVWSLARVADPNNPDDDTDDQTPSGPYGGLLSGEALDRPPVGEQIFLIEFDEGVMVNVTENRFFLPRFYGDEVAVGGEWQGTTLPGVFYNSACYGLEIDGRFGLAVIVHVRFFNFFLGRAIIYSWGTMADDGKSLTGTFGYLLDFTEGIAATLGTIADQYPIEGTRVD